MAARKIAEMQTADANSEEPFHFVTHFVKHPANLPVNSLPENDAQPSRLQRLDFLEAGALAVQGHAAEQLRRERRVPGAVDGNLVFFFNFVTWMSQALGQITIVCQEKQALGLGVEAANVE